MAVPTLVATPGATNANSYATLAEGNTYHDARLHSSDWTDATDDTRTVALIMATRLLDAMLEWVEYPTNPGVQALEWPRTGVIARDQLTVIDPDVIPEELKNATAEFARQLIAEDRTLDSDIETQGITSLKAGPVALTFREGVSARVVPDAVVNLLPHWWATVSGRSAGYVELIRA